MMKIQVRLMPLRFTESDRAIVLPKDVWRAMCKLGAKFHAPVQDVLPVRQGLEFARAIRDGLDWLDDNLPADGAARTNEEQFAASVAVLAEPAYRKTVFAVADLCQKGRGLHFADSIGW